MTEVLVYLIVGLMYAGAALSFVACLVFPWWFWRFLDPEKVTWVEWRWRNFEEKRQLRILVMKLRFLRWLLSEIAATEERISNLEASIRRLEEAGAGASQGGAVARRSPGP